MNIILYTYICLFIYFYVWVFCLEDSWISQSASFPRNQKQPGVDSLSPVASLPKQIFQPSAQQQPSKQVKVTCANCKKPLQKGQTAYQRKGSAHLFCSTTCLSSFSHKPTPKKLCVMCRKWVLYFVLLWHLNLILLKILMHASELLH